MSNKPIIALIRSGGQTGTDRAALEAGRAKKYPISGWCPKGGWAEDMLKPPGLRRRFPELVETPDEEIMQRTEWNVRDSHVTVVIGSLENSFGTTVTVTLANAYERPFIIVVDETPEEVMQWMEEEVGRGLTVNFAGPRESESPGIQKKAFEFICRMLEINDEEPEHDVFADLKSAKDLQISFTQQASDRVQDAAFADQRRPQVDRQREYPKVDANPVDPFAMFGNATIQTPQPVEHRQPSRAESFFDRGRPERAIESHPKTRPQQSRPVDGSPRKAAESRLPVKKAEEDSKIELDDLSFPDDNGKEPLPAGKPTKSKYVDPFAEFEDVD